jgi:CrcB protein
LTAVLFVVAAGLGAATRHRVNRFGRGWVGTLAVNVAGSFLLGWLLATGASSATTTVVGTGFCGSLTTFSMFSLEASEGSPRQRILVLASTLVLGLATAMGGHALG